MKEEFDIEDIWVPHEIHPETPTGGRPVTELFSQWDVDHVLATCRQRSAPYGLHFAERPWLSNSHLALQAAEFARDEGNYHPFHEALFKAYFSDARDIGDIQVILEVATQCGLDADEMQTALDEERYSRQVAKGSEEARRLGVTAVPTFFINDMPPITGAVHEDTFRKALQSIG